MIRHGTVQVASYVGPFSDVNNLVKSEWTAKESEKTFYDVWGTKVWDAKGVEGGGGVGP